MKKWQANIYLVSLLMISLLVGCNGSDGDGVISNTTNPPPQVSSITVTPANTQLTVTWAAVTGATSYKVFYNTTNNSFTATEFTGDSNTADTTCIITGLTNGTPCYVWVKAINSAGSSDFSSTQSSGTPSAAVTIPAVPASPAVSAGDTQLTATWAAVTGATSYKVFYNTTNNSSTATEFTGDSNTADTTCSITGLTNGTPYYVWVKAINSVGSSDFSSASSPGAPIASVTVPAAPVSLAVTPADTQLTVTWAAVTGATSYKVYFNTANNSSTATEFTGDSNTADTTCIITGLTSGTLYYVWVKAINSIGNSGFAPGSSTGYSTLTVSSGSLDPAFGTGGMVTTGFGTGSDTAYSVALQTDGKIVVAGSSSASGSNEFALERLNADGNLDTTFGTNGKVTTNFGAGTGAEAFSVAVQPDGKIVAAGYAGPFNRSYFALARYNSDGTLDTAFGTGGKVTTAIGVDYDEIYCVVIQADGKIVAAGYSQNSSTSDDFALARYNVDGTLDTTFDTDGKVTTVFGTGLDVAYSVAIQSDGKIVATGLSVNSTTFNDFALARYNSDGTLDTSFGTTGKITTDFGSSQEQIYGVKIQADGKIVAAGYSSSDFALARYNSDGALDTSFGAGGKVTTAIGTGEDVVKTIAIQPDGKIIAAGYAISASKGDFALARYTINGTLDITFGTGGKVTTVLGTAYDVANCIAIQSDGKIVAAGVADNGGRHFAVARYK